MKPSYKSPLYGDTAQGIYDQSDISEKSEIFKQINTTALQKVT